MAIIKQEVFLLLMSSMITDLTYLCNEHFVFKSETKHSCVKQGLLATDPLQNTGHNQWECLTKIEKKCKKIS